MKDKHTDRETKNFVLPAARNKDIVVQNLENEILIYDLKKHKAFNLNETAAKVYQACGEGKTFAELKRIDKLTDDLIFLALGQLKENGLIEFDKAEQKKFETTDRRALIKKAALASMVALPLITAITAPRAADAATGCTPAGQPCDLNNPGACCNLSCCHIGGGNYVCCNFE